MSGDINIVSPILPMNHRLLAPEEDHQLNSSQRMLPSGNTLTFQVYCVIGTDLSPQITSDVPTGFSLRLVQSCNRYYVL
jgi:hypothetical protein